MATNQLPKTITEVEFHKLISQIDVDRRAGRRDRCALRVMWFSGLRIGEVVAMVKGDTTPTKKGGLLHVRDGKGRKARAVFIPRELFEEIKEWETQLPAGSSILFPAFKGPTAGRAVTDRNLRAELSKLSRRAGVFKINRDGSRAPVNPHMLRHSYATRALSKGISLREVQHQLGHASILTTQIYLHIQNDQLDQRIHLAFDKDRHVDSSVAENEQSALEHRVSLALGESPGQSVHERVLIELISKDVATLGPKKALDLLNNALND